MAKPKVDLEYVYVFLRYIKWRSITAVQMSTRNSMYHEYLKLISPQWCKRQISQIKNDCKLELERGRGRV